MLRHLCDGSDGIDKRKSNKEKGRAKIGSVEESKSVLEEERNDCHHRHTVTARSIAPYSKYDDPQLDRHPIAAYRHAIVTRPTFISPVSYDLVIWHSSGPLVSSIYKSPFVSLWDVEGTVVFVYYILHDILMRFRLRMLSVLKDSDTVHRCDRLIYSDSSNFLP